MSWCVLGKHSVEGEHLGVLGWVLVGQNLVNRQSSLQWGEFTMHCAEDSDCCENKIMTESQT